LKQWPIIVNTEGLRYHNAISTEGGTWHFIVNGAKLKLSEL
jgi:hypothetical protein